MKNCSYGGDSTHALLLQRIGWLYSLRKDFQKAIHFSRQSLDIIYSNVTGSNINYSHAIKTYYNLRILYDSTGSYKLKQQATDSCIALALRLHKGYDFAFWLMPIREQSYLESGDYYKCIDLANLGETLCRAEPSGQYYLVYHLSSKANSLILLNRFEEARQLLRSTSDDFLKSGNPKNIAAYYGLMARLSEEAKDEKNSLIYVQKSIAANAIAKDPFISAQVINNLGYNLYSKNLRRNDVALSWYHKALAYAEVSEALNIYENIANIYLEKKMFDSAFFFFQKGFDQLKEGINESFLLAEDQKYFVVNNNYTEYLMTLMLDKADGYLEFYRFGKDSRNLDKAINSYKIIDRIFDKIRMSQNEVQSKLFWRNNLRRLYDHAIESCHLQNNSGDAFYFFEKSRAVILNDQLNEQRWSNQDDILKQSELRKQIVAKEKELDSIARGTDRYNELKRQVFIGKQDLARIQDQIKEKIPLYYQNFLDSNFISLTIVQQNILKDYGALVELFTGDSAVYSMVITKEKSYFNKLDKTLFNDLSLAYTSYISNADKLNSELNSFVSTSSRLYQLIFQNISLPPGRILVSMDSRNFPFESLVTVSKPVKYFLEDYAVSYTYSARYLLNDFMLNAPQSSNKFVGIAPVRFANGLAGLPGSDQSLQRVKNYFANAVNFIGEDASRNNFLKEYYKYSIVQLYTHATDSGYTGEPMIYFSDSVLSLSDFFYESKPSTSLIVLSACETANGRLYNGEGVFSFNRQFAALGIPSAIANLWSVDNASTYKLTELFYKYLSKGLTSDVALQKAKLEFIQTGPRENALPYYWAAPILAGKAGKIDAGEKMIWEWIIGGILIITLSFFIWQKRMYK